MSQNGKPFPYKPVVDCSHDEPLTVQADTRAVDINNIVKKINQGQAVPVMHGEPFYGDVSGISDLQEALIKVREADELFMSYPAELREKFGNDPVQFVEFMENPSNYGQAVELGLVQKRPGSDEPGPPPVAPATPPAQ